MEKKIKYLIKSATNNTVSFNKKYMKIRFYSNDDLT